MLGELCSVLGLHCNFGDRTRCAALARHEPCKGLSWLGPQVGWNSPRDLPTDFHALAVTSLLDQLRRPVDLLDLGVKLPGAAGNI